MHVLIVGAGAVGLTYGQAFAKAGCAVSYLIKPHHRASLEGGVTMLRHHLLWPGLTEERFTGFGLFDTPDAASFEGVDQVWITVPSNALDPQWMEALKQSLPETAVIFGLQPGPEDDARLARMFGADRLVKGVIGFLAYQYPLPGKTDAKGRSGIAMLIPPGAGGLGPSDHPAVIEAQKQLATGGLKVNLSDTLREDYLTVSALSLSHMAALELAGWSFRAFRKGEAGARTLAREAAFEALTIIDAHLGRTPNPARNRRLAGLGPLVSRVAGLVPSIDLETYLGFHFSKVGAQTRTVLRDLIALGRGSNLSVSALQALLAALEERDNA